MSEKIKKIIKKSIQIISWKKILIEEIIIFALSFCIIFLIEIHIKSGYIFFVFLIPIIISIIYLVFVLIYSFITVLKNKWW